MKSHCTETDGISTADEDQMGTYLSGQLSHVLWDRQIFVDGGVGGGEVEQLVDAQRVVLRCIEHLHRVGLQGLLLHREYLLHEVDVDALYRRHVVAELDGEEAVTGIIAGSVRRRRRRRLLTDRSRACL